MQRHLRASGSGCPQMSFRERAASGHAGHLFRLNHKTRHVSYIAVFKFIIMNILSKIILSTAVISAGSFSSFAQPGPEGTKKSPEEFISEHAGHIADELALDDSTREKFIGTFCRFHEEMHRLLNVPDKNNRPGDVRAQEKSSLSDKEIDRKIRDRFERRQKILDLQVRYYDKYRKFLNPRQVQKVYEMQHMHRDFNPGFRGCCDPSMHKGPRHDIRHHTGHGPVPRHSGPAL